MASILLKIVRICKSQFTCNYLKKEKVFLNFSFHFWNVHQVLNILEKRMIVIANLFSKLETVKILLRPLSKKRCFRRRLDSQHIKASQILAKSPWEIFWHIFSTFSGKLIWKISPLVLGEILVVFVNRLTSDGKYPVEHCKNLQHPIQTELFEKRKLFLNFLLHFLNLHQILNFLTKRIIVIANVFPKLETVKILVRPLFKKRCFITRIDSQHMKACHILAKS